jgi:hypothetical protein
MEGSGCQIGVMEAFLWDPSNLKVCRTGENHSIGSTHMYCIINIHDQESNRMKYAGPLPVITLGLR